MTSRYSPWKATSVPLLATIAYRQRPPTRRSISASVISPCFPLHQRLTSSGVVQALYTRCLGASNDLVMRTCSSVGNVTLAVRPLGIAAISLVLVIEVLQHDVQPLEPLRPGGLVGAHPVVDGLERVAVEPVQPPASFVPDLDRSHLSEHAQVLGHLWLGQAEQVHQGVDGPLAPGEGVQDLAAPRLGHRVERIRCRRCSWHGSIIYPYGNVTTPVTARGRAIRVWLRAQNSVGVFGSMPRRAS